ncbi:PaaI family thioesterase [Pseudoteredinibacter isoporae]|uniref:PaaI family thioesterase n=1 Tax=Pseudoteredinibacter isoporae TaxID=570281 RepID=UPI003102699C
MSAISEACKKAREEWKPELIIEQIPYAKLLGIETLMMGDELFYVLPPSKGNVGNPTLPALHGGAIGGFLEFAASLHLMMTLPTQVTPRVVDISVDYVRPGRLEPLYALCTVVRQGRKLVNVSVNCWHRSRDESVATARGHFLVD